ncbi:hypothetical protein ABMA10_04330 [Plantibacter sp. RU18]
MGFVLTLQRSTTHRAEHDQRISLMSLIGCASTFSIGIC